MNALQQALYEKLIAFEIDEPRVALTFDSRLARENGWSLAYTDRVIAEYKKFLFLACEAGHAVSPSEDVDQAWHLHLTYTRSYWNELCPNILGKPLHHGPTKGGAEEQAKFVDLYNQTLASYERLLGEPPPRDIWPPADRRFGEDLRHVTVNTERNWVIPKPRWSRWQSPLIGQTPLFAVGIFGLPLAAVTWNPLNWKGPEFLGFYIALATIAAVVALFIRLVLTPQETTVDLKARKSLGSYEVACLAGGPIRAVQSAFAAMVQAGSLAIVEEDSKVLGFIPHKKTKIEQGKQLPTSAPRMERALFEAVAIPAADLAPLTKAGLPVAQEIDEDLKKRGLVRSHGPTANSALAAFVMATPLLIGVPKIFVGLSRGRPIEFLVIACGATAFAAVLFLLAHRRLTANGNAIVESLKKEHESVSLPAFTGAGTLPPTQLAMALGLFGCGMLANGPLAKVHSMLPQAAGGGGCASGGGGCGGGGCGGGGCGGGCGGCGG